MKIDCPNCNRTFENPPSTDPIEIRTCPICHKDAVTSGLEKGAAYLDKAMFWNKVGLIAICVAIVSLILKSIFS